MKRSYSEITLPSRREFCSRACHLVSAGALGVLAGCGGGATSPDGGGTPLPVVSAARVPGGLTVTIDTSSPLATVGGMALVQAPGAYFLVTRTAQDSFTALTGTCTHEACTVSGYSGTTYVCPCHGLEFSTTGAVVRGPASRALQQYTTQFANGVLTIAA